MNITRSRRDLLRSGTLAGTVALGGLAGCVGELGTDDSDDSNEDPSPGNGTTDEESDGSNDSGGGGESDGSVMDAGPGWYADWIPPRSAFGDLDVAENGGLNYVARDTGPIEENRDLLSEEEYETAMEAFEADSQPGEGDVDRLLMVTAGSDLPIVYVTLGEYDVEAVQEEISETTEDRERYRGYEVHTGSPLPLNPMAADVDDIAAAVRDDALVFALGARAPLAKAFVDAGAGEGPRAVEENDAMDRLERALGGGYAAVGNLAPPPDRVTEGFGEDSLAAVGNSARIVEAGVAVDHALVYDGEVPDTGPVETAAAESDLEGVSVEVGDEVVAVSGTAQFGTLGGFLEEVVESEPVGGGSTRTPQPVLDFEWDGEDVVITHEGGDAITDQNTGEPGECDQSGLAVLANGEYRTCWPTPVENGDQTTIEAENGERIRLVWSPPGGEETQSLGVFVVPR